MRNLELVKVFGKMLKAAHLWFSRWPAERGEGSQNLSGRKPLSSTFSTEWVELLIRENRDVQPPEDL